MQGDVVIAEGREYVVVFDGRQSLIGDRASKPLFRHTPDKRPYNKTGKYSSSNSKSVELEINSNDTDTDEE